MAHSKIDIMNMALAHLGTRKAISATTDDSEEARVCNIFYDQTVDEILSEHAWSIARKNAELVKIEDDPTAEWLYSYRYPPDCLKILRLYFDPLIVSSLTYESTMDVTQSRVPFITIADPDTPDAMLIYTNYDDLWVQYICNSKPEEMYPPYFVQAVAYRLAFYISARIIGKRDDALQKQAEFYLNKARVKESNEQQDAQPPDSEFVSKRE